MLANYKLGANGYAPKPIQFDKFAEVVYYLGLCWLILNEAPPKRNR